MGLNHEQMQALPDEDLSGVSGGDIELQTLHFVCDECGYEKHVSNWRGSLSVGEAQVVAQECHNWCKGTTRTCTTGQMEYKP